MKNLLIVLSLTSFLFLSCGFNREPGTISVSGTGSVLVTPDTAQLRITISERGKTTKEAQSRSNIKIKEVMEGLKDAGVSENNIQTSAISFSNDTEWDANSRRNEIVGQIVSQSVSVKFVKLDESPDILPSVLDTLGSIDNIVIGNLIFSLDDPGPQYIDARQLAFQKAQQKASELAEHGEIQLGRAVSISEVSTGAISMTNNIQMLTDNETRGDIAGATSDIPGGEISIRYSIDVVFETY